VSSADGGAGAPRSWGAYSAELQPPEAAVSGSPFPLGA
jgi:hypothetical protein